MAAELSVNCPYLRGVNCGLRTLAQRHTRRFYSPVTLVSVEWTSYNVDRNVIADLVGKMPSLLETEGGEPSTPALEMCLMLCYSSGHYVSFLNLPEGEQNGPPGRERWYCLDDTLQSLVGPRA